MTLPPSSASDSIANNGKLPADITVADCLRLGTKELLSLHATSIPAARNTLGADESKDAMDVCRLEAEVLLSFVLNKDHSWLYAWPEQTVTTVDAAHYRQMLSERCSGKPVAYLTGWQEFWSMNFKVSPDVLIPRPDTELLVEISFDYLSQLQQFAGNATENNTSSRPNAPARILELGTGSGAIAIALASERCDAEITATDISSQALQIARNNAQRLLNESACRITFLQSDWFQKLALANSETSDTRNDSNNCYQLIVSNPPYIRSDDPHLSSAVTGISFEPNSALVAQDNGLQALQTIVEGAWPFMAEGALLALEHGHDQAEAVRQLMQHAGYLSIESRQDLAGVERVTLGHRPGIKL